MASGSNSRTKLELNLSIFIEILLLTDFHIWFDCHRPSIIFAFYLRHLYRFYRKEMFQINTFKKSCLRLHKIDVIIDKEISNTCLGKCIVMFQRTLFHFCKNNTSTTIKVALTLSWRKSALMLTRITDLTYNTPSSLTETR